jgi:hypothetical protein
VLGKPYHPIKFGSDQNCKDHFFLQTFALGAEEIAKNGKRKNFRVVPNKFLCFTSVYPALRTKVLVPSNRHGFW